LKIVDENYNDNIADIQEIDAALTEVELLQRFGGVVNTDEIVPQSGSKVKKNILDGSADTYVHWQT